MEQTPAVEVNNTALPRFSAFCVTAAFLVIELQCSRIRETAALTFAAKYSERSCSCFLTPILLHPIVLFAMHLPKFPRPPTSDFSALFRIRIVPLLLCSAHAITPSVEVLGFPAQPQLSGTCWILFAPLAHRNG